MYFFPGNHTVFSFFFPFFFAALSYDFYSFPRRVATEAMAEAALGGWLAARRVNILRMNQSRVSGASFGKVLGRRGELWPQEDSGCRRTRGREDTHKGWE